MSESPQQDTPKGTTRHAVISLAVILSFGAVLTWWTVEHADRCMREELLFYAMLVAEALPLDSIQSLSGTEADLPAPEYVRLKEYLAGAKAINGKYRSFSLLGRRADGPVFFFVDSEPAGSEKESSAGQIYGEISAEDLRVFAEKEPSVAGPAADRWGTWIRALVPLADPRTGGLIAVLGLDCDARDWKQMLLRASLPPILLTLAMAAVLVIGSGRFVRRAAFFGRALRRYPYLESTLAIATVGLFLSISASWLAQENELHARRSAFRQLAIDRTAAIGNVFQALHASELKALASFIEASEYISPEEFRNYTGFLVQNQAVTSWQWLRPVPEPEKERFVAQVRSEGLPISGIWQKDARGLPTPATGRDIYYPVVRVAPMAGYDFALGYDISSDPFLQEPLAEALRTGLVTCSDLIGQTPEAGGGKTVMVLRPVATSGEKAGRLGFVLAALNMDDVLERTDLDEAVVLDLVMVRQGRVKQLLAASPEGNSNRPGARLQVTRPVFAFGRTFFVNAYAGPEFVSLYPAHAGWLVALVGLLLTTILVTLTAVVRHKRQQLELLVAERTAELLDAKERMELAMRGGDLGTWEMDIRTRKISCDERSAVMLGYVPSEIEQNLSSWKKLVFPDDLPKIVKSMSRHLEGKSEFYEMEHRMRHKAGHWVWVLAKGRAIIRNPDGTPSGVCGTFLDITGRKKAEEDRKRLEEHLLQAQKMEAVGRLAGGVAHDLNNLLTPIIGYGEMLLTDLADDDRRRRPLDAILHAGFRARDLVGQLLSFSRKQAMAFKPVDINRIIKDIEPFLRRTIPEDVEIVVILTPRIPAVMADAVQIDQVIMNLVVNAAAAMPDGGKLTVETAMVELDDEYAARHLAIKPGLYLMLAVSDTGCGMDEETCEHIFEPFFSTKGEMGTGLGLATVFGIVKQHGGNIWVDSEPGKGSAFKIYLPVTRDEAVDRITCQDTAGDLTGTETILLVEDNREVRHLAGEILGRQGYQVLLAKDGPEALHALASHDGPVHLLLTDVVMPGMNGKELYEQALPSHPQMKVLYMSGYTDNVIAHRGVLEEGIAYLQKPFTVQAIAVKVRLVLDL